MGTVKPGFMNSRLLTVPFLFVIVNYLTLTLSAAGKGWSIGRRRSPQELRRLREQPELRASNLVSSNAREFVLHCWCTSSHGSIAIPPIVAIPIDVASAHQAAENAVGCGV